MIKPKQKTELPQKIYKNTHQQNCTRFENKAKVIYFHDYLKITYSNNKSDVTCWHNVNRIINFSW